MTYTKLDFDASRVSDDIRRLNPAVFGHAKGKPAPRCAQVQVQMQEPGQPPRLSLLNRTERRFYDSLSPDERARTVIQPTRHFPLAGGGTYTPDFMVYANEAIFVYEIKGGYRGPGAEQGHERYARAAALWSSCVLHFCKATWDAKAKAWKMEWWLNRLPACKMEKTT